MALTPNDVLNKQFRTTKSKDGKDGYDQDEVDDFLDEVLAEFQRLIAESDRLQAELRARPAAGGDGGVQPEIARLQAEVARLQGELEQARQQQDGLDGMNSEEYLRLARRVHEEHVREGVAKRDQLIAEGTSQAEALIAGGQQQAEALLAEAQERAAEVAREAQAQADAAFAEAQHRAEAAQAEARQRSEAQQAQAQQAHERRVAELSTQLAGLEQAKTGLEQNIAALQTFEREYRASLRSHLESRLAELDQSGTDGAPAPVPSVGAAAGWAPPAADDRVVGGEQDFGIESTGTGSTSSGSTGGEPSGDAPVTPSPTTGGIPDFGLARIDTASQDLPSFGQTGEQRFGAD